jgi:homoserine kinase type II
MSTISFFGTLVDTIKRHYELSAILDISVLPSLRSHASGPDSVYLVRTENGAYVLRPFRTEVLSAIELHNQFLRWAESQNLSFTQRIIQTRSRANFFEYENRNWWLSSYIEADSVFEWTKPTWSEEICEQSGRVLAQLHKVLRDFADNSPGVLSAANLSANLDESVVTGLEARLNEAFSKSRKFSSQKEVVAPLVSKALSQIQTSSSANKQLVHGDYHPGNLLFRNNYAIAIIDFEYLNFEPAIYDVAYAIVMFCADWTEDARIDIRKLKAFLAAYVSAQTSSELDLDLLIPYMNVASAICLTWFLERDLEDRTAQHFIHVVKQLENLSTMDILRAIGKTST